MQHNFAYTSSNMQIFLFYAAYLSSEIVLGTNEFEIVLSLINKVHYRNI